MEIVIQSYDFIRLLHSFSYKDFRLYKQSDATLILLSTLYWGELSFLILDCTNEQERAILEQSLELNIKP
jgi:hypothetical protein